MSDSDSSGNADCGGRYAIVAAKFNQAVTDELVAAATAEFARHGIHSERLHCVRVPGAFEIPMACRKLMASGEYAAIVALGAVIRGETPHFDYVAAECARGVAQLNLQGETPVIFGVLTTDTAAQARERAAADGKNRGAAAALAALEMAALMQSR